MDSYTKTSDSPTTDHSVATKGFTQIALGAAAGAFVAMRMNRTALLLTAGLAYAYWKKNQPAPSDVADLAMVEDSAPTEVFSISEPEAANPGWQEPGVPVPAPLEWAVRPAGAELKWPPSSSLQPFFSPPAGLNEPVAATPMETSVAPSETAWADLRAAIAPVISGPVEDKVESPLPVNQSGLVHPSEPMVEAAVSAAPTLGEMEVCLPSSPMVRHTMEAENAAPSDHLVMQPEESTEEEIPQSLLFETADEFNPTPQPLKPTETLIVPKSVTQPIDAEAPSKDASLNAPVVVPRDLQARKSFFDWLRG